MRGTATHSTDVRQDNAIVRWLEVFIEQQADNLMIVDLLRNNWPRVSHPGVVVVLDLFKIETQPTVHQLISTITSRLLSGLTAIDVLRALLPLRINCRRAQSACYGNHRRDRGLPVWHLSGHDRLDRVGDASSNVAIRTLSVPRDGQVAKLGIGPGIVPDPKRHSEWAEGRVRAPCSRARKQATNPIFK
jgi:anthranilate/para-aminobenzoate synthase component I